MKLIYLQLQFLQFFAVLLGFPVVFGERTIVLDKNSDAFMVWKIKGGPIYYENGFQLQDNTPRYRLPSDFDFKPFKMTKGIWLILPDVIHEINSTQQSNSNSTTIIDYNSGPAGPAATVKTVNTTMSFSFTSASQLIESVGVRYCLYGRARIHIKKLNKIMYTIAPSETLDYAWIDTTVPILGSSHFTVEADVGNPMDFVLVDRITGYYSEVTTSTTRRPSTSPRTHPPKSAANALSTSQFIIGLFVLISMLKPMY